MNCLTYLLNLLSQGVQMKLFYNGDHCIGVNENKIYDLGNNFKKELLNQSTLRYFPIEEYHSSLDLIKVFGVQEDKYINEIKKYYQ